MYKVTRMYQRESSRQFNRTIKSGLTLDEAQAHCQDPETSSSTCSRADRRRITEQRGPWFDGYTET